MASGVTVTDAIAFFDGSATLVAVTVTVCCAPTEAGAVYSPAVEIVPTEAVQTTAVFVEPVTAAENCCTSPAANVTVPGVTETTTAGFSVTVAVAFLVGSAALVAVIDACVWAATDAGAV
jgi:hypothetical protein